jgi:hypothetical protein
VAVPAVAVPVVVLRRRSRFRRQGRNTRLLCPHLGPQTVGRNENVISADEKTYGQARMGAAKSCKKSLPVQISGLAGEAPSMSLSFAMSCECTELGLLRRR